MGIVNEVRDGIGSLVDILKFGSDATNGSHSGAITKYANVANILGHVYIEQAVTQDDILLPTMSSLCSMYVGWILTALNLDSQVVGGGTVRDRLTAVTGESFSGANVIGDIMDRFDGKFRIVPSNQAGVFQVDKETEKFTVGKVIELQMMSLGMGESKVENTPSSTPTYSNTSTTNDPVTGQPVTKTVTTSTVGTKTVTTSKPGVIKVYITVRLCPQFLEEQVCKNFMSLNFVPTLSQRWKQMKAGEISFWKDFIFARDLVKRHAQLLKNDRTGIATQLSLKNKNKLFKWLAGIATSAERHNLANSMFIFSKQVFDQTCREANIDFNSFSSRQKFFDRTWSIVIVVVDQMYGRVTMYFNGVESPANYTYAMMNKVGAKGKDQFDLKEIMTAFGSGQSPKF